MLSFRKRGLAQLGVSGFGYPSWRGDFYSPGTKPADFLALYAESLPSVELNATGRRFPTVEQLSRWAAATPAGFTFSVKLTDAVAMRPSAALGSVTQLAHSAGSWAPYSFSFRRSSDVTQSWLAASSRLWHQTCATRSS